MNSQTTLFLVPKSLTWDKLCALFLGAMCVFGRRVEFEEIREAVRFEDEPCIPEDGVMDIDVRSPYNRSNEHGSATDKVVSTFGLSELDLPGVEHLVELLNINNQTGNLKNAQNSLVLAIRNAYELPHNVSLREHRLNVVATFWIAVETYFVACEQSDAPETWENPFTLANLKKMAEIAGFDPLILEPIEHKFKKIKQHRSRTAQKVGAMKPNVIFKVATVSGGQADGHLIVTNDAGVVSNWWKNFTNVVVIVSRRRDGHYAIFCRGKQSFDELYQVLNEREPGRWFLDKRPGSPMLLNGSTSRAVPASSLKPEELIALIYENYRHMSR